MKKSGFTLMELLVVVIMIGVLSSIALPQYRKAMDRSKAAEVMEVLPAIFEARERLRILNDYRWSSGSLVDEDDTAVGVTMRQLDIEVSGSVPNGGDCSGYEWQTKNFCYDFIAAGSVAQACVAAKARWGANRGLTGATIYYRGDKFSCTDGSTAGACDILNVADDSHRSGCI